MTDAAKDSTSKDDTTALEGTQSNPAKRKREDVQSLPSTSDRIPSGDEYDSIIRIDVGGAHGAAETFEIHRGILKFYSRYFQIAIANIEEGRFVESAQNMITLADEELEIFKAFKNWLYARKLSSLSVSVLSRLWCLGDRREIPLLQNECINQLLLSMQSDRSVPTGLVPYIYKNTTAGSPLRRVIVEVTAGLFNTTTVLQPKGPTSSWSEEPMRDLAIALIVRPTVESWSALVGRSCDWHMHEEGVRCK